MSALSFTAAEINIANSKTAITRPYTVGETVGVGELVAIKDSDDRAYKADADDTELARAVGIVVEVAKLLGTDTDAEAGDAVTVCIYGPVGGFNSLAAGTFGYASGTAGEIEDTNPGDADTYAFIVGRCETDKIFFVDMGISAPAYVT